MVSIAYGRGAKAFHPRASGGFQSSPAHIAAATAGEWTAIGSNTLSDVGYDYTGWNVPGYITNLQAIMDAWSGGAYDPTTHRLFIHGGGHNDYEGNEVYAFNLQTNAWSRLDNPSPYDDDAVNQVYPDNSPAPIHTYDVWAVNPVSGKLYRLGPSGSTLDEIWEYNTAAASQLTPGASKSGYWSQRAAVTWQDPNAGTSSWMDDESQFLIGNKDDGNWIHVRRYNPSSNTVGTAYETGLSGTPMSMAYSESRRIALIYRRTTSLIEFDAANNTSTARTITGDTPPADCSMAYDPVRDRFWLYSDTSASERRTLWWINPSTWVCTAITPSTGAHIAQGGVNGIFGRFRYCADYDVLIAVNKVNGSVYLYKPTGWVAP